MGDDNAMLPPMLPMPARVEIDGPRMDEVRRALETARVATSGALMGAGRMLGRFGNRVVW